MVQIYAADRDNGDRLLDVHRAVQCLCGAEFNRVWRQRPWSNLPFVPHTAAAFPNWVDLVYGYTPI